MRSIERALAICASAVLLHGSSPAPRCRCPQLAIERYFEQADIVLVGRATAVHNVTSPAGVERLEVTVAPLFTQGAPLKGSLDGIILATPRTTASCGVEVQPGRDYVIFASRGDPEEPRLAWFTTCSGSRPYFGGAEASRMQAFAGLPNNRVVARLVELAEHPPQQPSQEMDFHTSPACWTEPRTVHQGSPSPELRERVRITWDATVPRESGGTLSPNRAYRFRVRPLHPGEPTGAQELIVDVERPSLLRIAFTDAISPPQAHWINEKLLFVRAIWGRVVFTDLVIDAERGTVIYEEAVQDGGDAFIQYREQCLGQCPCLVVPGSAATLSQSPVARPAPGEAAGLEPLRQRSLAFLDGDWDGRVFSEPAGLRYTISRLKGMQPREEYPADVLEVREVDGAWWLRVALYEQSPCYDPDASPVHAGWLPAFSSAGRLVAGTYPGGC